MYIGYFFARDGGLVCLGIDLEVAVAGCRCFLGEGSRQIETVVASGGSKSSVFGAGTAGNCDGYYKQAFPIGLYATAGRFGARDVEAAVQISGRSVTPAVASRYTEEA
jgi:hypothetical protein